MEVTAIEPRRKGLSQLYLDGEAAVKLDTETLLKSGLKPGAELTDEALHELIQASDARRANEKALYLLEHRSHSKKELEDKIARTAASREAARVAAQHMEDIGLVDDEAFARDYARQLFTRKKFGSRRVRQELRLKGIAPELIDELLLEFGDEDESAAHIREILNRKYAGYAEDEKIRRRAMAALQRLGYGFDEIRAVLAAGQEEFPDDTGA